MHAYIKYLDLLTYWTNEAGDLQGGALSCINLEYRPHFLLDI